MLFARLRRRVPPPLLRIIPGVEVEFLSWVLLLSAPRPAASETAVRSPATYTPHPALPRAVFDPETCEFIYVAIHDRRDLRPGAVIPGPAVTVEDETSTVVTHLFDARIDAFGYIELTRGESSPASEPKSRSGVQSPQQYLRRGPDHPADR